MTGQTGMVGPGDRFVPYQECGELFRILDVTRHPHRQGFNALQYMKGICWAHTGTEIAHSFKTRAHYEGSRSELFREIYAVVTLIGLGQRGKLAAFSSVEFTGIHQYATNRNSVPA